jgi:hypothetical protein
MIKSSCARLALFLGIDLLQAGSTHTKESERSGQMNTNGRDNQKMPKDSHIL